MTKHESAFDAIQKAIWVDQVRIADVGGGCPHCDARDQEGRDLIAKILSLQATTDLLTADEADDIVTAIEFMMAEGYW